MDGQVSELHARRALLPAGWASDVAIRIGPTGRIREVRVDAPATDDMGRVGTLLPGIPNAHSHAFQRALAGRTEQNNPADDSFWGWREALYRFIDWLEPDDLRVIGRMAYLEMLEAGYTSVAEFHYLHHGRRKEADVDCKTMAQLMLDSAEDVGIRITLLPTLYQFGGFGEKPATGGQLRFVCSVGEFLDLFAQLQPRTGERAALAIGLHSLRAVSESGIQQVLDFRRTHDPMMPVHIHVAEQVREVEDCVTWSGQRPVEWLLRRKLLDARWCLVHATHISAFETAGIAETGAVIALCPTTEANLGDGFFPLQQFLESGGRIAVGSDSQVSIDPVEELRWLEYTQRLRTHRRNIAACASQLHTGARLYRAACAGGAIAVGQGSGAIERGLAADFVEIDTAAPNLAGAEGDELLDCLVFSGRYNVVRNVMVGGRWTIRDGRHPDRDLIRGEFADLQSRLWRTVH